MLVITTLTINAALPTNTRTWPIMKTTIIHNTTTIIILASLVRSKHPQNIYIDIFFKMIGGKETQNRQNYWGQGAIRQTAEGKGKL